MFGQYLDPNYVPPPPQAPAPDPTYAPVEPGMYSPVYGTPQPAYPTPLPPIEPAMQTIPPPMEPGMYSETAPPPSVRPPLEPGVYEPTYTRPGEYAPRDSASTYYGGPVGVPYHNGAFNPQRQMAPWGQPGMNRVETLSPASGAPPTHRLVPSLGDATVMQSGTSPFPTPPPMPGATGRADILGAMSGGQGSAPPHPAASVGPTAPELGYRVSTGDPGVVALPSPGGAYPRPARRSDLPDPLVDRLAGLYGGGQRKTSQSMPLPPRKR